MINELDDDGNIKLKIILVGESGVGKTNLINIIKGVDFNSNQESSINCSFFKTEMIIENFNFNIYIWDTIGQERIKKLTKIFYKNSKIVILVYDITSKESFNQLQFWLKEVKEELGPDIILGVLGNKKDLFMKEEVSEEQGSQYAKSIGARWVITSAKTERKNFVIFIEDLIRDYIKATGLKNNQKINFAENKNIVLKNDDSNNNNKKKKKKKCFFF